MKNKQLELVEVRRIDKLFKKIKRRSKKTGEDISWIDLWRKLESAPKKGVIK